MRIIAILSVVVTALMGCATVRPEVENLTPVSQPQALVITTTLTRSIAAGKMEQGLLPGTYKAVAENSLGTFYQGPHRPFYERVLPNGPVVLRPGGFWMPKLPTVTARLFFVFEPEQHTAASVDAAIQGMQSPTTGTVAGVPAGVGANALGSALGGAIALALTGIDPVHRSLS